MSVWWIEATEDYMKLFSWGKDGGTESTVWGLWLIEAKSLFSIAILKFVGDSREAFHTHAFNSISWIIKGKLIENMKYGKSRLNVYRPSLTPIITKRNTFHRVDSVGTTWVLTLRGPWSDTWLEYAKDKYTTLTHGRKIVS
jgi:hypothetical protein